MNSRHFCWVNSMKDRKKPAIRFKGFTEDWEQRKVNEICSISTGKSNTQDKIDDGKYPFYVRSPIIERSNRYLYDEEAVLTVGDGVGTGKVFHYVNGKYDIHQRVYRLFDFSGDIDAKFFYHWFSENFYNRVMYMTAKTSVDSVRLEMIADMEITAPSYDEQKKISSYLDNFDNLIALHQRKHDKLVNIKKSMLEKMFPREGKNVPDIRFSGFTEDWEQRKLGEVGTTYTGLSGKTKEDFGHGNGKFVTYMNVFSNTVGMPDMTETVEIDDSQNKVLFGDVLFTTSSETPEEVGLSSVWLGNAENTYLNSFCFGYRPTVEFNPYYLAYMLRSSSMRKKITLLAQGISRYNISKNKMMDIEMPIPNKEEQKQIGSYFRNLDHLITLHQRKLEKLKNIKKSCLEKMFI